MKKSAMTLLIVILITFFASFHAYATTVFYVDPDFGGSSDGSASNPWTSLGSAWTTINTALASDDVIVYFSAREASSDTPETTSTTISIKRTDTSTNRLTLDGKSYYNTNDSSPSWSSTANGSDPGHVRDGGNAFKISSSGSCIYSSGITTAKQNYVTIQGFITENTGSGKCAAYWAGDHIVITDIHCSQTAAASAGPNFYFQCILNDGDTTCPGDRDGGASCFPSTDIEWSYLKVDGGYGEALYHCGCYTQTDPECLTGHSDVWIHDNIFKDASLRGKQGDGIETKPNVSGVVIEDNEIYWEDQDETSTNYTMAYGIIVNSSATIQRNFIHDYPGDGILLNENADDAEGFRDASQTKILNNIIVNVGQRTVGSWTHGIHANHESGDDDWDNVLIANNTIYKAQGRGINIEHSTASTGFTIQNNIISSVDNVEFYIAGSGALSTHDNNLFYDTSGNVYNVGGTIVSYDGDITAKEAHSINNDNPDFVNTDTPYTPKNFTPKFDSIARKNAFMSSYFSDDFFGSERSKGDGLWDIGAVEYFLAQPTGLVIP